MNEEIEVNVYEVDGVEYIELAQVNLENNKYIILGNENDDEDILVQKVISEDEFASLESEEEILKVLNQFTIDVEKELA